MENLNIEKKVVSGLIALTMATGLAVGNISEAYAEKKSNKTKITYTKEEEEYYKKITRAIAEYPKTKITNPDKFGKFTKNIIEIEGITCGEYVIKEGDNLSRVSQKICSHLRIDIETLYWPFIAITNNYPRTAHPGDIIIFPTDPELLKNLYQYNRSKGNNSRYIISVDAYGSKKEKKKLSRKALRKTLNEIYGGNLCLDEDTLLKYLKLTGLDRKYVLSNTDDYYGDQEWEVTDYIPDINQFDNTSSLVETDNNFMLFYENADNEPCLQVVRKA